MDTNVPRKPEVIKICYDDSLKNNSQLFKNYLTYICVDLSSVYILFLPDFIV